MTVTGIKKISQHCYNSRKNSGLKGLTKASKLISKRSSIQYFTPLKLTLNGQSFFDQLLHGVSHGVAGGSGRRERQFEQVRLYIRKTGVEYEIQLGLVGDLGHVLVSIHDLGYVQNLLRQQITNLLPAYLSLVLGRQLDQLQSDRPYLPGYALGGEGPAVFLLLEELERNLTASGAAVGPEGLREARNLALEGLIEHGRGAADVGEVDEVAVDVHVTDRAHRVVVLVVLFVLELPQAAVEENGVEDRGHSLVHLATLHTQIEQLRSCVHFDDVLQYKFFL